jgi:hypothetical protein
MKSNQFTVLKLSAFVLAYAGGWLFLTVFNLPSLLLLAGFSSLYTSIIVASGAASLAACYIGSVPKQDIEQPIRAKKLYILWWIATFFLSTFLLYPLITLSGWGGPWNLGLIALAAITAGVSQVLLQVATTHHARYIPEVIAILIGLSMMAPGFLSSSLYVMGFIASYVTYLYIRPRLEGFVQDVKLTTPPTSPRSNGDEDFAIGQGDTPPDDGIIHHAWPVPCRDLWIQQREIALVASAGMLMCACAMIPALQPYMPWLLPLASIGSAAYMCAGYMMIQQQASDISEIDYTRPINLRLFNMGFVLACLAFVVFLFQHQWPLWFAARALERISWGPFFLQLAAFDLMVMWALYYMVEEYKVDKVTLCIIFCSIALGGVLLNLFFPSVLFLFTPEIEMGSFLFMCATALFCSCFFNALTYDGLTTGQDAATIWRASSPIRSSKYSQKNLFFTNADSPEMPTGDRKGYWPCF